MKIPQWNVWYHFKKECKEPAKWTVSIPIEEEQYNFADALLVGSMLTTLINNADTVKIACMAQLINVIAPIMTEPGGRSWVQTIYYPFLLTSQYGRGTALNPKVDCPEYACKISNHVPYLDCAAVLSKEEDSLSIILINKSLDEDISCCIDIGSIAHCAVQTTLTASDLNSTNTADTNCINKTQRELQINGKAFSASLPPASWNLIKIAMEGCGCYAQMPYHMSPFLIFHIKSDNNKAL